MSTAPTAIQANNAKSVTAGRTRSLYTSAATLLLVFMLIGFGNFYRNGSYPDNTEIAPERKGLVIAHGLVMTAWMLLFTIQPALILKSNLRAHRILGWFGAALAVGVVVLGVWVSVTSLSPAESGRQHDGFVLSVMAIFAGFVTVGIANRKRPDVHRPLMLMGTLAVMTAAFDRITWITNLYSYLNLYSYSPMKFFAQYTGPLSFGLLFLCVKCLLTRTFDRHLALACVAFAGVSALAIAFTKSSVWSHIAELLPS